MLCLYGVQGVASSNPAAPTKRNKQKASSSELAFCFSASESRDQELPSPPEHNTLLAMTASTAAWLDSQIADVRAELDRLISYGPDPEFIPQLAEWLPVVPCAGLIDLYYDIWYCVPSRLAFRIAVLHMHDAEKLSDFLALAERVLVDALACDAFAEQIHDDDELYEITGWLKRRSRQQS